jgi:hypothetical protein
MNPYAAVIALTALLTVAGCTPTAGPLWTPETPRNGAGQPVDPVYGTPIPGYPAPNGGRS